MVVEDGYRDRLMSPGLCTFKKDYLQGQSYNDSEP